MYTQVTQRCSGFLDSFFHYLTIDFFTSEATMMQFCPSLKNSLRSGPSEIFFNTQNSQLKKGCFPGQTHKCKFFILKLFQQLHCRGVAPFLQRLWFVISCFVFLLFFLCSTCHILHEKLNESSWIFFHIDFWCQSSIFMHPFQTPPI